MKTKILSSIMVIGIALVMGLAGGIAFFYDVEASENNKMQAGALDLKVDFRQWYNGEELTNTEIYPAEDLDGSPLFSLGDVKPGDWGQLKFSIHVENNPAYICMMFTPTMNDDVSTTEPESHVDDQENAEDMWDGELMQNIEINIYHDNNGDCELDMDEISTGWMPLTEMVPAEGTVVTFNLDCLNLHWIENCTTYWIGVEWRIPSSVQNIIQTDALEMDIGFYAIQARHLSPNTQLVNGSFEYPLVETDAGWDIFPSSEVPGWTVEWTQGTKDAAEDYEGGDLPEEAYLELQNDTVVDTPAVDGVQYAELDTDWQGPVGNGSEPANVVISQDIHLCPGCYELSFWWRGREDRAGDNIKAEVKYDGTSVVNRVSIGAGTNEWARETMCFEVVYGETAVTVMFSEEGDPDSYGAFLDNVEIYPISACP